MNEAGEVAAFLQGALLAVVHKGQVPHLAVDHVEQTKGADGIYRRYFDVITASGLRIRVIVAPLGEDTPDDSLG